MKKFGLILALTLLTLPPLIAQVSNPSIIVVSSAPSGSCGGSGLPMQYVFSTGVLYACQNGTWGQIGSGTGNISGTVSATHLTMGTGPDTVSDSPATFDGTTFVFPNPMKLTGITGHGTAGVVGIDTSGNLSVNGGGAEGTVALATNSIASGACQTVTAGSVNSTAATGATTANTLTWTPVGSIQTVSGYQVSTAGALSIDGYITSGFVNFNVCNWSLNPITPGALTLKWSILP